MSNLFFIQRHGHHERISVDCLKPACIGSLTNRFDDVTSTAGGKDLSVLDEDIHPNFDHTIPTRRGRQVKNQYSFKTTTFFFLTFALLVFVFCICSYLSSIHEKANCIAIFWTGRPHSLGSCHFFIFIFGGVWAICLPHKGGGVPLSALPKDTTSELAGLFSTTSHKCRAPSREAVDTIF